MLSGLGSKSGSSSSRTVPQHRARVLAAGSIAHGDKCAGIRGKHVKGRGQSTGSLCHTGYRDRLKEAMHIRNRAQCLACSKCSVNTLLVSLVY